METCKGKTDRQTDGQNVTLVIIHEGQRQSFGDSTEALGGGLCWCDGVDRSALHLSLPLSLSPSVSLSLSPSVAASFDG